MKFCAIERVGVFCDTYAPDTEERREAEVRIVTLRLRIQPLTPTIAAGIDAFVRRQLFTTKGDPVPHLREIILALDVPRQLLQIHAAPDTTRAAIALDQVKISQLRARLRTEADGWTLRFKAAFGPCSRDELAFVQDWFTTQRFVTFTAAQGDLFEEVPPDNTPEPPVVDGGVVEPATATPRPRRARGVTH